MRVVGWTSSPEEEKLQISAGLDNAAIASFPVIHLTADIVKLTLARFALALTLLLPAKASAQAAPGEVRLRPTDIIRVDLLREPDLSGEFAVDERGYVTLPLIGSQQVTEAAWTSLREALRSAYARELNSPEDVVLTPLRRVFVYGSVNKPGPVLAPVTASFAEAVALAEGASPEGDLRRIRVLRDGQTIVRRAAVESSVVGAGVQSGDQIFVDRRSWVDRNSGPALSAFVGLAGIVVTLIVSR